MFSCLVFIFPAYFPRHYSLRLKWSPKKAVQNGARRRSERKRSVKISAFKSSFQHTYLYGEIKPPTNETAKRVQWKKRGITWEEGGKSGGPLKANFLCTEQSVSDGNVVIVSLKMHWAEQDEQKKPSIFPLSAIVAALPSTSSPANPDRWQNYRFALQSVFSCRGHANRMSS